MFYSTIRFEDCFGECMQCALETWISYGKPSVCGLFSGQAAKMVTLLTLPVALGASHLEFAVPADTGLRTLKRRLLRSLLKASLSHHLLLELHSAFLLLCKAWQVQSRL